MQRFMPVEELFQVYINYLQPFLEISFIKGILSFELALEKFHRKLKLRINNKNNILKNKKYLMELQEAYDGYNTDLIIKNAHLYNTEERKLLNLNFQDLILNSEQLTNSSNQDLLDIDVLNNKMKEENNSSSENENILQKYNQIIFFNQENEINLMEDDYNKLVCLQDHKKNKMNKNYKQSQVKQRMKNVFIDRHNSFILPRIGSK
jgi:hypothetical protein